MFERFDDGARRAVVLAQEEARLLGHNWIGTEHLLLGVLALDGPVSDALEQLGVSTQAVRDQIEEMVGPVDDPPSRHIPFTPRAKAVLELSLREALRLGDRSIGAAHVLLGLLREGQGMACQALLVLGVDPEHLRSVVEDVADERSAGATGRSAAAAIAIDDTQAVLTTLRDALGDDLRILRISVSGPDEIRAAVRAGHGDDVLSVMVVRRDGRWTLGGTS